VGLFAGQSFLKTLQTRLLANTWVAGVLQYAPRLPGHALPSVMVWNAGVGPWWAATVEVIPNPCSTHRSRSQTFVSMGNGAS